MPGIVDRRFWIARRNCGNLPIGVTVPHGLDLDDVGTIVAQHRGRHRRRHERSNVKNADATERQLGPHPRRRLLLLRHRLPRPREDFAANLKGCARRVKAQVASSGTSQRGGSPRATRSTLSKALRKRATWLSQVGPAKCAVSTTLSSWSSGLLAGGGS